MNDKKEGKGIYKWKDGRMYDGDWKNDAQHGVGAYVLPSGKSKKGRWENGRRIEWIAEPKENKENGAAVVE